MIQSWEQEKAQAEKFEATVRPRPRKNTKLRKGNKHKEIFLNSFVLFITLAICLFVSEGCVRLLGFNPHEEEISAHEPSTFYGYKGKPNFSAVDTGLEYRVEVTQNSKGFRDQERPYEKDTSSFRIIVLGDSFMWGLGVSQDKIFTKKLERALGKKTEIINSGVSSYSPSVELLWLENEGLKYKPDLVLMAFYTGNDIEVFGERPSHRPYFTEAPDGALQLENYPAPLENVRRYFSKRKDFEKPLKLKVWLSHHSALYNFSKSIFKSSPEFTQLFIKLGIISAERLEQENPYARYKNYDTDYWQRNFRWTAKIIKRMKDQSVSNGSEFLVMMIPEKIRANKEAWESTRKVFLLDSRFDANGPAREMIDELRANGIEVFDLAPSMGPSGKDFYFKLNDHWNSRGHEKAAQEMAGYLRERKKTSRNEWTETIKTA